METVDQARETIFRELTTDDSEVRGEYLKSFEAEAKAFSEYMAQAFVKWRGFDNEFKDERPSTMESWKRTKRKWAVASALPRCSKISSML